MSGKRKIADAAIAAAKTAEKDAALRLQHEADVAALDSGTAKGTASKYGWYELKASVSDGSRLPLEGIRMVKRAPPKQLNLSQFVVGVQIKTQPRVSEVLRGPFVRTMTIAGCSIEVTFKVKDEREAGF